MKRLKTWWKSRNRLTKFLIGGALAILVLAVLAGGGGGEEASSPPAATSAPRATNAPRATATPKPTAIPRPTATPTTLDLNAAIQFDGAQFIITNNDDFDWINVEFDLNGGLLSSGYLFKTVVIEAGETYTVGSMQFAKKGGERFNPYALKPQKMVITCKTEQGRDGFWYGEWQ